MPPLVLSKDQLREKADEILQRSYYKLDEDTRAGELFEWIIEWFRRLLRPIGFFFEGLYATSPVLYYILVVALALLVVLLIFHIVWTIAKASRLRRSIYLQGAREDKRVHLPEYWEDEARNASAREDYLSASRYLLHAALLRLEQKRKGTLRRAATHREYLRRFRDTPVSQPLGEMVEIVESRWFGGVPCLRNDYERCNAAYASMLHTLGSSHV